MDKVAKAVGLTPEDFRRRNFINEGETTATSQVIRDRVDMNGLLDRAFELSDYHKKREQFALQGAEPASGTPEEFRKAVQDELVEMGKLVKVIGLKVDQ